MKNTRVTAALALMAGSILLTACGMSGPFPGVPELHSSPRDDAPGRPDEKLKKVAAPQVGYRIDENRYFEIVPTTTGACYFAKLYYIDKAKGIRSYVSGWEPGYNLRTNFIIDAANDQYLIGPVVRGNTDCSSGGGGCSGSSLPYSTDAGMTWKRTWAQRPYVASGVSGSVAYSGGGSDLTKRLDLTKAHLAEIEWIYLPNFTFVPRKSPLDNIFHCTENGKE